MRIMRIGCLRAGHLPAVLPIHLINPTIIKSMYELMRKGILNLCRTLYPILADANFP
jgi:hypothetical protein